MRKALTFVAILLAALAVTPAGVAFAKTPAAPPAKATKTWNITLTQSPTVTKPDNATAEACVGSFAGVNKEKDAQGRFYIHWGGIQQCAPSPQAQTLKMVLYRWDTPTEDWEEVSEKTDSSIGAVYLLSVWAEPYCNGAVSANYYMQAYGTAAGVHATPYPSTSAVQTVGCYLY